MWSFRITLALLSQNITLILCSKTFSMTAFSSKYKISKMKFHIHIQKNLFTYFHIIWYSSYIMILSHIYNSHFNPPPLLSLRIKLYYKVVICIRISSLTSILQIRKAVLFFGIALKAGSTVAVIRLSILRNTWKINASEFINKAAILHSFLTRMLLSMWYPWPDSTLSPSWSLSPRLHLWPGTWLKIFILVLLPLT
jgi:hypothetical protein